MPDGYLDADLLVRLLSGDDQAKLGAVRDLPRRAERGEVTLRLAAWTVGEVVFVLSSPRLYRMPRTAVDETVRFIVELPYLNVESRPTLLRALELLETTARSFGDAMLAATMEQAGDSTVYAYDRDFDRIPGVTRREP